MSERTATIDDIVGDAKQVDADLQAFTRDTDLLSSRQPNLTAKYTKRWVAIHDGEVRADAASLARLLGEVDALDLPRARVVIRFVDNNDRRMIL